ncbi:MAG: hypothetical protein AB7V08_00920 [Elusimicrobiales bacterium]
MRYVAKSAPAPRRRRSRKTSSRALNPAEFLRRNFYYINGEQLIKISSRLLYEAA